MLDEPIPLGLLVSLVGLREGPRADLCEQVLVPEVGPVPALVGLSEPDRFLWNLGLLQSPWAETPIEFLEYVRPQLRNVRLLCSRLRALKFMKENVHFVLLNKGLLFMLHGQVFDRHLLGFL